MQFPEQNLAENNLGLESQNFTMTQTSHFFKILSSSLYEDKPNAVLRELSANALDAHIDAGIPNTPIEITLPNSFSPELVVKDFGSGMSKEMLERVYTSYGASTKTDNNNDIGGFGLGSKSPFALTESFTVESTHKGTTTHVACYLDSGLPKFVVTHEAKTDMPDGTTVRVPISDITTQTEIAFKCEVLFNLWDTMPVIKGAKIAYSKEKSFIYENSDVLALDVTKASYSTMYYSRESNVSHVAVGPFAYAIPAAIQAEIKNCKGFNKIKKSFVSDVFSYSENSNAQTYLTYILKFDIGELELAPSRERIEDTGANRKAILSRLDNLINLVSLNEQDDFTLVKAATSIINVTLEKGQRRHDFIEDGDNVIVGLSKNLLLDTFSKFISHNNPIKTSKMLQEINSVQNLVTTALKFTYLPFFKSMDKLCEKMPDVVSTYKFLNDIDISNSPISTYVDYNPDSYYKLSMKCVPLSKIVEKTLLDVLDECCTSKNIARFKPTIINKTRGDKFRHQERHVYKYASNFVFNYSLLILIDEPSNKKVTAIINKLIKHNLLDYDYHNIGIVYAASDESFASLKKITNLAKKEHNSNVEILEKDKLLEIYENVKHLIPKPKTATRRTAQDTPVVATVRSGHDRELNKDVTAKNLYSLILSGQYTDIVISPNANSRFKSHFDPTLKHIFKSILDNVLFVTFDKASELNTKRYLNALTECNKQNINVHVMPKLSKNAPFHGLFTLMKMFLHLDKYKDLIKRKTVRLQREVFKCTALYEINESFEKTPEYRKHAIEFTKALCNVSVANLPSHFSFPQFYGLDQNVKAARHYLRHNLSKRLYYIVSGAAKDILTPEEINLILTESEKQSVRDTLIEATKLIGEQHGSTH